MRKVIKLICLLCFLVMLVSCAAENEDVIKDAHSIILSIDEKMTEVESVSTTFSMNVEGEYSVDNEKEKLVYIMETHNQWSNKPLAIHNETFAKIYLGEKTCHESIEQYFVPGELNTYSVYVLKQKNDENNEWSQQTVSMKDASSMFYNTGTIPNWSILDAGINSFIEEVEIKGVPCYLLTGQTNRTILNYLFNVDILDGFLQKFFSYILTDEIAYEVYIEKETGYPMQLDIDLSNNINRDTCDISSCLISLHFNSYNKTDAIEVPKKVSVVSVNQEQMEQINVTLMDVWKQTVQNDESMDTSKIDDTQTNDTAK